MNADIINLKTKPGTMGCFQPKMSPSLVTIDDLRQPSPYHFLGYLVESGFKIIIYVVIAGKLEAQPRVVKSIRSYPEIFICVKGRYEIWWGNEGENVVELGPLDTFAVPSGLMRTVKNVTDGDGQILVIYDNVDDPNAGIVVPQSVIDADKAAGRDI